MKMHNTLYDALRVMRWGLLVWVSLCFLFALFIVVMARFYQGVFEKRDTQYPSTVLEGVSQNPFDVWIVICVGLFPWAIFEGMKLYFPEQEKTRWLIAILIIAGIWGMRASIPFLANI